MKKNQRKYSHFVPDMIDLYKKGNNISQIGRLIGIDATTVKRYLDKDNQIEPPIIRAETKPEEKFIQINPPKRDEKWEQAIKQEEIESLKESLNPGDIIEYKTTIPDPDKEGSQRTIKKRAKIVKMYPNIVEIKNREQTKKETISYIDLIMMDSLVNHKKR